MKNEFASYYRPTATEFSELWESATFSFDTSSLRNLYGYSEPTRNELLKLLKKLKGRVWSPYQVAKEYQLGRIEEIRKCITAYEKLKADLKNTLAPLTDEKKHPFVDENLLAELGALRSRVESAMDEGRLRLEKLKDEDSIRDALDAILKNCVGNKLADTELDELYKEGKERYEKRIPPGYMDKDKGEPAMYGDLIVWKELIQYAKRNSKSVILVTDDTKEDWWWRDGSATIGPRPELREEFRRESGFDCYFYTFDRFVAEAQNTVAKISDKAAEEVKTSAQEQRRATRDRLLKDIGQVRTAFEAYEASLPSGLPSELAKQMWINSLTGTGAAYIPRPEVSGYAKISPEVVQYLRETREFNDALAKGGGAAWRDAEALIDLKRSRLISDDWKLLNDAMDTTTPSTEDPPEN